MFFSKIFLYVYCVAFLFRLNYNLFQFLFFLNILFCFLFGTRFDQEPQYNSIQFTSLNLRSKPASICAQFCSQFICLSVCFVSPTHLSAHCLRCSCFCCCFALRTVHRASSSSNRMGQPIAFVFCFCFARALCVCVFFCFALLCSAQFDELLSSPFVKLRCTLKPSRLRALLHCTTLHCG